MKKTALAMAGAMCAIAATASDPIITTAFTPDPAPYVHGDTVYLFVDHDEDDAQYFKMRDWMLYSSTDMLNWTFRGVPMTTATFAWAKQGDNAWAAQAVERDGRWYWYMCAEDLNHPGMHAIGVAVAPRPEGPYTDPIGRPLATGTLGFIDPSVFIDDDGTAWLFWGNNGLWYAPLGADMVSLAGPVKEVPGLTDPDAFGPLREKRDYATNTMMLKTGYEEGPWIMKRNGIYYLVYAAGGVPEHMAYSWSHSIHGPWHYGGRIMDEAPGSFTIHGGSIEVAGRNFMFTHNGLAPNGGGFRRATVVEEFEWQADSIPFIPHTRGRLAKGIATLNPYLRTEAETMAESYGLKTDRLDGTDHYLTSVHNGDWLCLRDVDFGDTAPTSLEIAFAALRDGGTAEFYLDRLGGKLLGAITTDGSALHYETALNAPEATGVHDLYILFRGGDGELFNPDWWKLKQ